MDKFKNFIQELLFPKFCLGCQKEGTFLCEDCRALLDICQFNYCLCEAHGNPKRILPSKECLDILKCQNCQKSNLSGLLFSLPYKDMGVSGLLTKKLIKHFKYPPYLKSLSPILANILLEHFFLTKKNTNAFWENSVLIPIPLHIKKLRERGYNQSEELAKQLSEVLRVPVLNDVLIKIKNTPSQAKLNKEERQKNLQGAFVTKNASAIAKHKVFLVDDVYTTGATMEECAKILLSAKAKEVWGIAFAREN